LSKRKCPYCGNEQELVYPGKMDGDEISFIQKHGEKIITDSFFESVETHTCTNCGEKFDFVSDSRGNIKKK